MNSMLLRALTLLALASSSLAQKSAVQSTGGGSSRGSAPEIDVTLIGAALALVLGGIFLLTTARRKKLASS